MKSKFSTKTLLKVIGNEWRSVKYLIVKFGVINMLEARKLQIRLHKLVKKEKLTVKIINGK